MGANRVKRLYLVAYDYGQGGVWAMIRANSEDEIKERLPELTVVPSPPAWMTPERVAKLEEEAQDADGPYRGFIAMLVSKRDD